MTVASFPADWTTMVTVHRGGKDRKGDPLPVADHEIGPCLVAAGSTADPVDRSDLVTYDAILSLDDPQADILEGDTVTIPAGPWPSGDFRVDGGPGPTPLGVAVPLRRG